MCPPSPSFSGSPVSLSLPGSGLPDSPSCAWLPWGAAFSSGPELLLSVASSSLAVGTVGPVCRALIAPLAAARPNSSLPSTPAGALPFWVFSPVIAQHLPLDLLMDPGVSAARD